MQGVATKIARVSSCSSFRKYRTTRIHCIRRPFPASVSPTVGVLFSATQATTHAPHPVQRSMSITIAHRRFIAKRPPSKDVLVEPLALGVDRADQRPFHPRLDEGDPRGVPGGSLRGALDGRGKEGVRVPAPVRGVPPVP